MSICDLLIAVDNADKEIVTEALYHTDFSVEFCESQAFFTIPEVETDLSLDNSLISMQGSLDEIGEDNYAVVTVELLNNSLSIRGNPHKFGIRALLMYGNMAAEALH